MKSLKLIYLSQLILNMISSTSGEYVPDINFGNKEIETAVKNAGFKNYYDAFSLNKKPILLDIHQGAPRIKFQTLVDYINSEGTINPSGPIIETPQKIKVSLKPHQKRTLYEMISRENTYYRYSSKYNINLLSDNVGSGKSLCILSLIAEKPKAEFKSDIFYSTKKSSIQGSQWYGSNYDIPYTLSAENTALELNTNLIVVPHNIFIQWKEYITNHTSLQAYFVAGKKNYTELCKSKKNIIDECNKNDIILVKSTMYKKLYSLLNEKILDSDTPSLLSYNNENVVNNPMVTMRQDMRLLKSEANGAYKIYNNLVQDGATKEKRDQIKKKCIAVKDKMINIIDNYDWDKIGVDNEIRQTQFEARISGYYFQRVIVDEVDSIRLPAFPYIYSKQIWYISSSINNIIYPYGKKKYNYTTGTYKILSAGISGTGFLKEILVNMFKNYSYSNHIRLDTFRGLFNIIRNNNNFIQHSIHIPEPIVNLIECYTPPHLHAIKHAINKGALKAFNAGDHKKAIEILGCKGGSEQDLIKQITQKLKNEQTPLEKKIVSKTEYLGIIQNKVINIKTLLENPDLDILTLSLYENELTENKKNIKNTKIVIKKAKEQIKSLKAKVRGIEERLGDLKSKQCPICYCPFDKPGVTPCCNNIFCIECITMSLAISKECPLCRHKINIQDVNLIINDTGESEKFTEEPKLLTKLDNLVEILKKKSKKRFMIFSEYDETLRQIKNELNKLQITYSGIKGAGSTIKNIISKFKEGEFKVLLLNAKHFGAGLNLQFTDEIIIYHRMSKDLECQVIGRAQRLGRKDPLTINYLCYDNEYL